MTYHCHFCNTPLIPGVAYPIWGNRRYCSLVCKESFIRSILPFEEWPPAMQHPLPFPPSALNTPKETLKVKVRQDLGIATLVDEWFTWINNPLQTVYNRVEFKFKGIYVVLAKLRPETEKDD